MSTAPAVAPGDLRVVALLRGVNVGGRTIPMAQLRTVVAASGARAVRTVLASGNVLLDVTEDAPLADVRADLETRISEAFGYDAHLALLPLELATALADAVPWPDDDTAHGYVAVSTEPGLLHQATTVAEEQVDAEAEDAAPGGVAANDAPARSAALPAPDDAPPGTHLARAATQRTLGEQLAANEAAATRVTELRQRAAGRTEVCSVVAASFLIGGAERDVASGNVVESWQHPAADLAARLAAFGLDALWWRCSRGSSLTTPLAKTLARAHFSRTTTRNVRTLRRLA